MPYTPEYKYSLLQGENNPKIDWFPVAASQTINVGDFVQINPTTRLLEVAAQASTTIVGLANGNIVTGASPSLTNDRIPVISARFAVFRVPFDTSGAKKTFAQTDKFTTLYDLLNKNTLNPNDTTGGMLQVIDYDNTGLTADVVITQAAQYLK